jgi:hypothetical protein
MLANAADAASETELRTAFVGILGEMTRFDVLILSKLADAPSPEGWYFLRTDRLPEEVSLSDDSQKEITPPRKDVEVSLGNLARLGCLSPTSTVGGFESFGLIRLTLLGSSFIKACTVSTIQRA